MPADATSPISVVIVTYDSADAIERSLPAIRAELRDGDELIVCDNGSSDGTVARARELAPDARVLEIPGNPGFGVACNRGAEAAASPLLLLLNPDAVVAPGFREAIVRPLAENRGWSAWQALLTSGGGSEVNTWGGAIHYTGIAWAGGAGRPIAEAPAAGEPAEIPFPSGGCLLIERELWRELGGFSEPYFLYHEDTDLGLRLWLRGLRVGLEPSALAEHEYEFDKGKAKWFYLERNRWATILRTYPPRLLLLLTPALLATELALHLVALAGGWFGEKLRADVAVARWLPRLLRERRAIQGEAVATPADFADRLSPELDSAYLGRAAGSPALAWLLRTYWRGVRALL